MTEVEEMLNAVDEAIEAAEELNEVVAAESDEVAEAEGSEVAETNENGVAETDESGVAVLSAENSRAAADGSRLSTAKKKKAINLEDLIYIKKYIQNMVADAKTAADDIYYKKTDIVSEARRAEFASTADRSYYSQSLIKPSYIRVVEKYNDDYDGNSFMIILADNDVDFDNDVIVLGETGDYINTFVTGRNEDYDTEDQKGWQIRVAVDTELTVIGLHDIYIVRDFESYDKITEKIEELEEQNRGAINEFCDLDTGVITFHKRFEVHVFEVATYVPGKEITFGSKTQIPEGEWYYVNDDGTLGDGFIAEVYTRITSSTYPFIYIMTSVESSNDFYNLAAHDDLTIQFNFICDKANTADTAEKAHNLKIGPWMSSDAFTKSVENKYTYHETTIYYVDKGYYHHLKLIPLATSGTTHIDIGFVHLVSGHNVWVSTDYAYLDDFDNIITKKFVFVITPSTAYGNDSAAVRVYVFNGDGTPDQSYDFSGLWRLNYRKALFI